MAKKINNENIFISKAEMIDALMDHITDSIYFKDLKSRFIRINKACAEKFKMKSADEAVGKTDFDIFTEEHARQAFEDEQNIIKTGEPIINIEEKETWEEGVKWASTTKMPLYNKNGRIIGTFGITRDITDKKKAEEEIWYLSFHDKLTGLYNRAYFEEEIKRLNTQRQLPLSIIFCDVNGLKEMNDNFGYDRGDQLLCKVAEILRICFRNEDTIVRWGGDEFIIVLPLTDSSAADNIIERIYERCGQSYKLDFPVSVSIGMAVKNKIQQDINFIINAAKKRMLKNKRDIKRNA